LIEFILQQMTRIARIWEIGLENEKTDNVVKRLQLFAYSNIDKLDLLLKKNNLTDFYNNYLPFD